MSTSGKGAAAMKDNNTNRERTSAYPTGSGLGSEWGCENAVVGVIDDVDQVSGAVDALKASGFSEDKMLVLAGEEGVERLDPTGKRHGWRGRIIRAVQVLGSEREEIERKVQELRAGHFLIGVWEIVEEEQKTRASEALAAHGAHSINYHSRLTTHGLVP
jgi:hypothetical protein